MTALKQNTIECVGLIPAGGKAERISPLPCSKEIFPFLKDKRVLFGFPDIILQPDDVFVRLMDRMKASNADIVLGLYFVDNPQKMDMVDLKTYRTINDIQIKPLQTNLKWTWIVAAWNDTFTQFMHDIVCRHLDSIAASDRTFPKEEDRKEIFMGGVILEAIGSELKTDQIMFPQGTYIDIGSPEDMLAAIRTHADRSTHTKGHGKNT